MIHRDHIRTKTGRSAIGALLFALALSLFGASGASAQSCSEYGGVLDGTADYSPLPNPPSQLQIDVNCTIINYPVGNELDTNFSFFSNPGGEDNQFLVVFNNVVHTGNMSCNATHEHKIWFTNGSSSKIKQNCQNLLIPVEKIDKQNPAGTTTAAIGVPFTYTLTIPVLFDPATGNVINDAGSVNDLHGIVVTDDLNETGVDLTYVSHEVYWKDTLLPIAHNFDNTGGLLTFDNFDFEGDDVVEAGRQFLIEITVVLEDTPTNAPGTQFINTARWEFGRLIDGVFYQPLPGENGITEPLTIAAPDLVVTKTGPATLGLTLNLGQVGTFSVDVHNTGQTDAWDVTLVDQLPDGPSGGMCDLTPTVTSAQVFEADGTTAVSPPLVQGTDFSFDYAGAPTCELTLTMLTPAAAIGPDQRLIISYESKLDPDTQDGETLTNVVGATEWFNGDSSNPERVQFVRTLTDGTPGVADHEDAHTVTAQIYGFFFEKSVENVTTGVSPAAAAAPGDTLRYTLRLQATDVALSDLTFRDDFAELNPFQVFQAGSLDIVSVPPGADTSGTDPNGGPNGEGILDVGNLSVPVDSDIEVVFELTLESGLADGTVVTNQADLLDLSDSKMADSDDPNVNGQADPDVDGDEDPTVVVVSNAPVGPLTKTNTQATASIGETFSYLVTVPATPFPFDIYDVEISDDLSLSSADLRFVDVTKVAGGGSWVPFNSGTATDLLIEGTGTGIDIPADTQVTLEITVVVEDTPTNVDGLSFTNTATFVYNRVNNDSDSQLPGDLGETEPMTLVEPDLTMTKSGPAAMAIGTPETFTLDVQNTGTGPAWNPTLTDLLPDTPSGGTCGTAPGTITAQVFESDGVTSVSPVLVQGVDYTVSWDGSGCLLTLAFISDQGTIDVGQRLIVSYQAQLDADTQNGATLTNVAGAVEWFSWDDSSTDRRTYSEVVTDGTPGVSDHEDAHTVTVALPGYLFEKTVANVDSGEDPATSAVPGDTLRYTLRLENTSDIPLPDVAFVDDLGSLNPSPVFEPGTLTLVTVPPGADTSGTDPNGGTNGTGLVDVRNLSLPAMGQIVIEFEITLQNPLPDATLVTNQTQLLQAGNPYAESDDPNVNGAADPFVDGDEDPTVVPIQLPPVGPLVKNITQATATIGETFTYEIRVPETPFDFDIYDVQITDDLTTSSADLRFLGVTKISTDGTWQPTNLGTDTSLVIEGTNEGIDIAAGTQAIIEITVVLEDTPTNVAPLVFTNTASFVYHTIDGDPGSQQPGEPDESDPMTIVEPDLTMDKSGPATMAIGTPETFTLDVQNAGDSPAWNVTLTDLLPDTPSGGTCGTPPANVTAEVFESDGSTSVSGVLSQGVDYSVSWDGAGCLLTLSVLSDQGTIGPGQRLIVTYDAELDAGTSNGVTLTNVAGAVEWFSWDDGSPDRRTYSETVTDGTVGVTDHEDAFTTGVALPSYFFEKTVANVDSGADPATTAVPGDVLRYTVRLQNTSDIPLNDLAFVDDLGSLNPSAVFVPGSLNLVTVPLGADTTGTDPNGGSNGTGLVDVRNLSLPGVGELVIEFEIELDSPLVDGTPVTNQTQLLLGGSPYAVSDDPNVNGQANPFVDGDEDPTVVTIQLPPVGPLQKVSTQSTASIGESFTYEITVPETTFDFDIFDVQITDDLAATGADLRLVGMTKLSGGGTWQPTNLGTDTDLVIAGTNEGIDIPAGTQATIEITVVLEDTPGNTWGTPFTNTASFSYRTIDGDITSEQPGEPGSDTGMTIVEPYELVMDKTGPATMSVGTPGTFTLDVENRGDGPAWNLTVTDLLPDTVDGGTCGTSPANVTAEVFDGGGTSVAVLDPGTDYTTSFSGCLFTLTVTSALGTIEAGGRLVVSYDLQLDPDTVDGASLTNYAGAVEWFSWEDSSPDRRPYTETVTDGSPGTEDFQDLHTLNVTLPTLLFEKTVSNVSTAESPATSATPGDRLRYELRVENLSDVPVNDFALVDDLGSLNSPAVFAPNTLVLDPVPVGADDSGTDPAGGTNGTGLVQVTGLSVPANGDVVVIAFEIELAAVIPDGTLVTNQTQLQISGSTFDLSDDPTVGGDEDPTVVPITSAPSFVVEKTSTDLNGAPLLAGETLEYTITVVNVGTDDAIDVTLRDAVPANTAYVPGSTTLNGNPVADGAGGVSPLATGMLIGAPGAPAGSMPADPSAGGTSTATITFQVAVDPGVPDGTIISNQGFVTSVPGGVVDDPSDDPDTPIADDPTRDIVGDLPLLFAAKDVVLIDNGTTPGVVEPGDTLQYTITITNSGTVPATDVVLQDDVPANASYDAGTTTLNGEPVPDGPGSSFPLIAGLPVSSDDLTPPIPAPGAGTINPGQTATVVFELLVAATAAPGDVISNQATISTIEVPSLLTDGDGNPSTGPEPTLVVVGDVQALAITKQVSVVGGGPVLAGSTLEYVVTVTNIATLDAVGVVITDDVPAQVAYVTGSGTMNGSPVGVDETGLPVLRADYSGSYGPLPPGGTIVLRFQAVVDPGLAIGTPITNEATVEWNTSEMESASVTVQVGGMPGVGVLSGRVWHDADFDDVFDGSGIETELAGWSVELYRNGGLIQTVTTAADGTWRIPGLAANDLSGDQYELRFSAPGAGANTAALGLASSPFTNGLQQISDIIVPSGSTVQDLNLPIDPNGVVYDALVRAPVAGATLTLLNAGSGNPVSPDCFQDTSQQGQVTLGSGFYKFDLDFSEASCQTGEGYVIAVVPPGGGFTGSVSQLIPPTTDASTAPYSVPVCSGDAVGATANCEAQAQATAPSGGEATTYYLHLTLTDGSPPETSQIFNNHIALDPVLNGDIAIAKTTPKINVSRGQLVPYEITIYNNLGGVLEDVIIEDRFPAGFRYVEGSAHLEGDPVEPDVNGRVLRWVDVDLQPNSSHELVLLLAVGAGVSDGEYVNRAQVLSATEVPISGVATATVRIVPDPTFSCTDVMGKVFDDANRNGIQDSGEKGLQGVRVLTARGLAATTDQHGRYHITCAVAPNDMRGSNFILKLDDRTLPTGYRMSGRQTQIKRATAGKALRFNYAASIHRVVSLDMADPVFEPGSVEMREQWKPRLGLLMEQLEKGPSVLRLSYVADVEDAGLVERRLRVIQEWVEREWESMGGDYALSIEPEVFWRRGAPPPRPAARVREER